MKKNNVTSLKTLDRDKYDRLRAVYKVFEKINEKKLSKCDYIPSKTEEKIYNIYLKCLKKRYELRKEMEAFLDNRAKERFLNEKAWEFREIEIVNNDMLRSVSIDNYALYMSITKKYTGEYKKEWLKFRKDTFDFVIELSKTEKKFEEIKAKNLTNAALKANSR